MLAVFAPALPADHPRLGVRLAEALHDAGHDVTVIAGAPLGGRPPQVGRYEQVDGGWRLGRLLGVLRAARSLVALPSVRCVICGGIEAWMLALVLKPFKRWHVVFEASEDYPATITRWSTSPLVQRLLALVVLAWIKLCSTRTELVVLARRQNSSQYRSAHAQVFMANTVPAGTRPTSPENLSRREPGEPLRVVSAGLFSPERGSDVLLEALRSCSAELPAGSIELLIVGQFALMQAADYERAVSALDVVASVEIVDWMDYAELMGEVLPGQHVGLALFQPWTDNLRNPMPNKVFDYLACGVVPIAPAWGEELRALVPDDAAFLVDTSDASAVAHALVRAWKDEPERRNRAHRGLVVTKGLRSTGGGQRSVLVAIDELVSEPR